MKVVLLRRKEKKRKETRPFTKAGAERGRNEAGGVTENKDIDLLEGAEATARQRDQNYNPSMIAMVAPVLLESDPT